MAWTCHAVPASTGKPCGHVNQADQAMTAYYYAGIEVCRECGCTRRASDLRVEKAAKQKEHR